MDREDWAQTARFKFAKINSKDFVPCVRAVARGQYTGMGITIGMQILKATSRNGSNGISVTPAV